MCMQLWYADRGVCAGSVVHMYLWCSTMGAGEVCVYWLCCVVHMQLWCGIMGAADRGGALSWPRLTLCHLLCGCQQAHAACSHLLPGAICPDIGSYV